MTCFNAVHRGHGEIGDDHVRLQLLCGVHQREPVVQSSVSNTTSNWASNAGVSRRYDRSIASLRHPARWIRTSNHCQREIRLAHAALGESTLSLDSDRKRR